MSAATTTVRTESVELALAARVPALTVFFIGVAMLYIVGFAPSTRAHNAAHDTRHANGFPCH